MFIHGRVSCKGTKVCSVTVSAKGWFRAQAKREMKTEEYRQLSRIRNGVKTVPSILRHIYRVDWMPVRCYILSCFSSGVNSCIECP